jgi:hypothetical protein
MCARHVVKKWLRVPIGVNGILLGTSAMRITSRRLLMTSLTIVVSLITLNLEEVVGLSSGKLGRKICCKFKKDVRCIGWVNGKKLCYLEETSEEQFYEKHELQFAFCPLFPETELVALMATLKEDGISIRKRWKG